ncbi:hypothetical protein KEM48_012938 [Puccinia striiformis f. sp. tritici PST-130]|nr:hypothetical protein KEM48_012938 [Puccinia striiformis f. sp. tritici PST-130]
MVVFYSKAKILMVWNFGGKKKPRPKALRPARVPSPQQADRSLGSSPLMSSRLSHQLSSNNLVDSFLSFSTSYSDTGLWGIYMVSENLTNVDDLVISPTRMATYVTAPTEIKTMVTSGKRMTPQEIQMAVEAVTPGHDPCRCPNIAVAALGRVEGLLEYNRIRANMSSLTW